MFFPSYGNKVRTAADVLPEAVAALSAAVLEPSEDNDVDMYCEPSEDEGTCVLRFKDELSSSSALGEEESGGRRRSGVGGFESNGGENVGLLAAVRRCNTYEPGDFLPVLVGDDQVGWVNDAMRVALEG